MQLNLAFSSPTMNLSLFVDRDWTVQSSKNEETLTLIEYATPDERGWSFGSVLMWWTNPLSTSKGDPYIIGQAMDGT